jgi:hypothetical protein
MNPVITTKYICKKCNGRIHWAKIDKEAHWEDVHGQPKYVPYDWELDIHCYCGTVTDAEIIKECYAEHKRFAASEIKRQQNEAFENALGADLANALQNITGDGL